MRAAIAGLALLLLGLFGGAGPIAALPGGMLWGEVREPPSDWSFHRRHRGE